MLPRRGKPGLLIAAAVVLTLLACRVHAFVHLFYTHAGSTVTQPQVAQAYDTRELDVEPRIPRVIHQIWHNWTDARSEELPGDWLESRRSCVDLNPGWENRVSCDRWMASGDGAC